jgi:hypothetical protein
VSSVPIARSAHREAPAEVGRVVPAVVVATLASIAVFVSAQTILLLRAHHLLWDSLEHLEGPHSATAMVGSIWPDVLFGAGRFCGVMVAGLALVAVGRRRSYALPAIAWFLLSFTHGPDLLQLIHPVPVGVGWLRMPALSISDPSWWMNAWVGSVIDYVLALLPAAVLASGLRGAGTLAVERRWLPAGVPWRDGQRLISAAAFALCGFALVLAMYTAAVAQDARFPWGHVPVMLPLFVFGFLLADRRRSFLWAAVAVPVMVQLDWYSVAFPGSSSIARAMLLTLPFVGVTALGLAPAPVARTLDRLRRTPLSALVLVNVLNVADAVLTWMALDSHQAAEANPVVRMLGLPAKVMLVAAISLVLYRRRPRALAWAVLIFLVVMAWHVAGIYLTAHT